MFVKRSMVACCIALSCFAPVVVMAKSSNSSKGVVPPSLSPIRLTVEPGDTLWGLSSTYQISLSKLERWNHLTQTSTLQIGQKLIIGWSTVQATKTALSGRSGGVDAAYKAGILGEEIASYVREFIGVPYVWGGESTSGFDCSGLVSFVFGHFGIPLGHSSYDQYDQGTPVSRNSLIPGDLVFFSSDGSGPSHVGIYIGNGEFVDAENPGVRVASLDSSYWSSCYYGAKRIL